MGRNEERSGKIKFLARSSQNLETLLARPNFVLPFNRRHDRPYYEVGTTWLANHRGGVGRHSAARHRRRWPRIVPRCAQPLANDFFVLMCFSCCHRTPPPLEPLGGPSLSFMYYSFIHLTFLYTQTRTLSLLNTFLLVFFLCTIANRTKLQVLKD